MRVKNVDISLVETRVKQAHTGPVYTRIKKVVVGTLYTRDNKRRYMYGLRSNQNGRYKPELYLNQQGRYWWVYFWACKYHLPLARSQLSTGNAVSVFEAPKTGQPTIKVIVLNMLGYLMIDFKTMYKQQSELAEKQGSISGFS